MLHRSPTSGKIGNTVLDSKTGNSAIGGTISNQLPRSATTGNTGNVTCLLAWRQPSGKDSGKSGKNSGNDFGNNSLARPSSHHITI